MGPRLLTRHSLLESLKLLGFYLGCYLVLISVAVTAPLIRGGAPVVDVIAFLPDQMALPGTLALPLALVTALLATVGRMRDDGELIALQAAGVSTIRVALALLPLAILTSILVGILAHQVLPDAFQRWREGKSSLLRQAVATKVMRREFIYQEKGTSLSALDVDGNVLRGLFARHLSDDGTEVTLYAPTARWVAINDDLEQNMSLHLELTDARLVSVSSASTANDMTGIFPKMTIRLQQHERNWSSKADTRSTPALADAVRSYGTALDMLSAQAEAESPQLFFERAARIDPEPLQIGDVIRWQGLISHLGSEQPTPVVTALPASLRATSRELRGQPLSAADEAFICTQLNQALAELVHADKAWATLPKPVQASPRTPAIARLLLDQELEGLVHQASSSAVLNSIVYRIGLQPETFRRNIGKVFQRELREHQMTWHLRWLLAALPVAYWMLACGLALTIPSSNRLLAASIGLATVLVTILPGIGLTKSVEGNLSFNPGLLMWSVWSLVLGCGTWLTWRRR